MSFNFNTTKTTPEFEAKLEEARSKATNTITGTRLASDIAIDYELRKESINTMESLLRVVYNTVGFDEEDLEKTITFARKSEYGRVPYLMNILTKVYSWPLSKHSDPKEIPIVQQEILEVLASNGINLTHDLLLDHKEAKGRTSYLDEKTFSIEPAIEPDIEEYHFLSLTMAERIGLPYCDNKLTMALFKAAEAKARKKAEQHLKAVELELENHRALDAATKEAA